MKTVALSDVARIDRRVTDPETLDPATPYLGLEHIGRGGTIAGSATVASAGVRSAKFRFDESHVLYGKLRPNLAKVSRPTMSGVCSTDILPIRPGPKLDRDFLAHYLLLPEMTEYAETRTSGANLPRLSPTVLAAFPIPLPPLDEQRRIAAILDKADEIRTKRREALAHLDVLPQALFETIFDPTTWRERWRVGTIGELAVSVQYGSSAKAGASGHWPMLRMGNVTDNGRLDLSDMKYIDLAPAEVPKYSVQRGDMLFNRTNSKEKVGKAAVVDTDRPLAIAGYLVRVRFPEASTARYVCSYLVSRQGLKVRQKLAKAAVNQANINASEMRQIAIAHPPLDLQREFAAKVAAIEAQRAVGERALAADDELFASLQHRAFRGEL